MIVDDEPLVIKAISYIVENNLDDIDIVAKISDGANAIEMAGEKNPDIIFMDIKLAGLNGLQAIKEINNFSPDTIIVIISAYDNFSYAQKAVKLGVMDYLLKPVDKRDIINILQKARNRLKNKSLENVKSLSENVNYNFNPPWKLEKKLFNAIEYGNKEKALIELDNIVNSLDIGDDLTVLEIYFQEITAVILRLLYEDMPEEEFKDIKRNELQQKIRKAETRDELINSVKENFLFLIKTVSSSVNINNNPLLIKARNYIDKNYNKDITLKEIADYVALSPSYLSKLFKEQFKITVIDYLTEVRINAAIRLLDNSKLAIKQIAARVGYNDSNYFSKVFKKNTGQTPTEFRSE